MPSPTTNSLIASFKKLKDSLRGPVHQARRNSYQHLNGLKNLEAKTQKALAETSHLPTTFIRELLTACQRFDNAHPSDQPAALEHFISLLQGEPDWLSKRVSPSPAEPSAASSLWHDWSTKPVSTLKGVGQTTEKKLAPSLRCL